MASYYHLPSTHVLLSFLRANPVLQAHLTDELTNNGLLALGIVKQK